MREEKEDRCRSDIVFYRIENSEYWEKNGYSIDANIDQYPKITIMIENWLFSFDKKEKIITSSLIIDDNSK